MFCGDKMLKLSEDIVLDIKKKFPNSDVEHIIPYLFDAIIQKTLRDGACTIREFGKFISYGRTSGKTYQKTIRFKFRIATSLIKKLNSDKYWLNRIPVEAKLEFNEEHEKKCQDKRQIRDQNIKAINEAEKLSNKKTIQNINTHNILDILHNEENKK